MRRLSTHQAPGTRLKSRGGEQERSAGSSYQEYTISEVECEISNYFYDCCPSEPWPVITYVLTMTRSDSYYFYVVIMPGVLLTLLSFAGRFHPSFLRSWLSMTPFCTHHATCMPPSWPLD